MATRDYIKDERRLSISSKEEAARRQPGGSNAGEYTHVANYNFAGNACGLPGSYPINSIERARAALSLAHNAKDPECIRQQVYKKYPSLKPSDAK